MQRVLYVSRNPSHSPRFADVRRYVSTAQISGDASTTFWTWRSMASQSGMTLAARFLMGP
jgi:hypothetical protein